MNILNNKPVSIKEMNIDQLKEKLATTKDSFAIELITALIAEKETAAKLAMTVKTSAKREVKLPDAYDVIQPLFVSLRGQIGKGTVTDTVINAMFQDILKHTAIPMTESLAKKLFDNTVYHNSYSNIANKNQVSDSQDCLNRFISFVAMTNQAKVMLPMLPDAYITESTDAVFNHAKYPFDKPEATKPAKPEATKPAKPEATKPAKPEATKPAKAKK